MWQTSYIFLYSHFLLACMYYCPKETCSIMKANLISKLIRAFSFQRFHTISICFFPKYDNFIENGGKVGEVGQIFTSQCRTC